MKKNVLKKWIAMTLAMTMTFSLSGFTTLAAEESSETAVLEVSAGEDAGETVTEESADPSDEDAVNEDAVNEDAANEDAADENDVIEEEHGPDTGEGEETSEENTGEDVEEAEADASKEPETTEEADASNTETGTEEAEPADTAEEADDSEALEVTEEAEELTESIVPALDAVRESVSVAATAIEIAGASYLYADLSGVPEGAQVTITAGETEYTPSDFTAIGDTGIVYTSDNPLSGSLYGTDPAKVTSYTGFYQSKGVNASGADYDVISSATGFSGFHVKDIPAIIARNENGIVGILDNVEVDAVTYAEAKILEQAGKTLSNEQQSALAVTLNEEPFVNPETAGKTVEIASASYGYTCKYGDGEFIINPDDSVDGFVWSDYKNALYAAVISDGANSAGAVWWTDLYGESATGGPHYNKVEIAVNNGTSKGSNQATVNRYAAMYNSGKPELKAGTYTVTLYARGYNTVSTQIEVRSSYDGEVTAGLSADRTAVELTGTEGFENAKATVYRTEGSGRLTQYFYYAQDADVVDGKVMLDTSENELIDATYTVTINSSNYAPFTTTFDYAYSGYVLMNIPYSVFYGTAGASVADVDAVSSATNKTGNYGFTGGAYHSGKTEEDGQAVGGANGSRMQGVIWPVKAEQFSDVTALGGAEVTDTSSVVTATAGHGSVTSQTLVGYEALVEQPAYSFYVLAEEPANYLVLSGGSFTSANSAQQMPEAETDVIYGGRWGDVQVNVTAEAVADKLVDAIVFTADDGTKAGLYHLDQIWRSGAQLAWKKTVIDDLDGKTITSITYYCMVKDSDLTDGTAPAYANYVYEYPVSAKISTIFTGEVSAVFDSASQITVSGLPGDAQNVKAKVYHVVSPRPAVYSYLTPVEADAATDRFVPVEVPVTDGKIPIVKGAATNAAGTEETFGEPVLGKTYTVVLTSDNYGNITAAADYTAIKTEVAGTEYVYTDLNALAQGTENVTAGGTSYALSDFTQIGETGIAYYSGTPLSGTLYGIDKEAVTSYTALYNSLGVAASGENYDVISSATNFSGYHVKDIPAIIARSEQGITGVYLGDTVIEAVPYVDASILKAAGKDLTAEQEALLAVTLNADPTVNPETEKKAVSVGAASYNYSCKYGNGEFVINPDDTVEGFVWSDYKNALYAAVVSDGTSSAGAVWWIDLYGESATGGPHYNKVEIAVNNGTSKGSNQATVNRYAAMYNSEKPELKAGTYTVTLYAKGYETVSAQIEVLSSYDGAVTAALSDDKTAVELTGVESFENAKATVYRTEGSGRQTKYFYYAQNADVVDGKVMLDTSENELIDATYTVTVSSSNYAPVTTTFDHSSAQAQEIDCDTSAPVVNKKTQNYTVTGAQGELTFAIADTSVAAVASVNGATVTVKGIKPGITKLTVTAAAAEGYEAAEKEFEIRVVPGATSKVRATNLADCMKITWEKVEGATKYDVYRDGKRIVSTSNLYCPDKDARYKNLQKFTYKVVAYTTVNKVKLESTEARTTTYYRVMTVGVNKLTNTEAGKLKVTYTTNPKSTGYVVRYGQKADLSDGKTKTVFGAGTNSYTISGVKKGTTYYVQVRTFYRKDNVDYFSTYSTIKHLKITK